MPNNIASSKITDNDGFYSELYYNGTWLYKDPSGKVINSKQGKWVKHDTILLFPDGSAIDLNHVFIIYEQ